MQNNFDEELKAVGAGNPVSSASVQSASLAAFADLFGGSPRRVQHSRLTTKTHRIRPDAVDETR